VIEQGSKPRVPVPPPLFGRVLTDSDDPAGVARIADLLACVRDSADEECVPVAGLGWARLG
jgi:hypothetical protein